MLSKNKNKRIQNRFFYSGFFLFIVLLSISLVSSLPYQQWTEVDLKHPIRINGASSDSIYANITVVNPLNEVVARGAMSYNSTNEQHNFTVPAGVTGVLGVYSYDITAVGGGINETSTFTFQITPSGEDGLLGFYFLMIILSYGVVVLGIYKRDIPITILGTFALFFVGIYILFNGLDVYKNYLTEGFALITLGIASYISVRMAHELTTQ